MPTRRIRTGSVRTPASAAIPSLAAARARSIASSVRERITGKRALPREPRAPARGSFPAVSSSPPELQIAGVYRWSVTIQRDRRGHFLKLLGLALGVALIASVFRDVELTAIANRLAAIGPLGGLLVLVPALGSGLIETVGWHGVFSLIGTRIGFPALFRVRTATEAAAQTLPAGVLVSESLKVALLTRGGMTLDAAVSGTLARKYLLMTSQS